MNNFKFTSKIRIFAIISFVLIVLGMALGTVLHFISDGFFNYGGEYSSYKTVTVSYVYAEFASADDVEAVCKEKFEQAGLKSYVSTAANSSTSNEITYKFSSSTDDNALKAVVDEINAAFKEAADNEIANSRASYHTEQAVLGGEKAIIRATITLAVIIAVSALYALVRYKLSAMFTVLALQLHNTGLFAAILALCRIPVTSAVATFAVILSLATALCTILTLEAIKKARAESGNEKLSVEEICDASGRKTFKTNLVFCAFLALASIFVLVFTAISSMSPTVILSASLCALVAFAVSFYGSAAAPAVYPLFFKMCGKTAKPSQKKGN